MTEHDTDLENMRKAIELAERCSPIAERIPKVGAIVAIGSTIIGTGRRGNGSDSDDEHAEWHALHSIPDRTQLPLATIYTTLEPCTPPVRSNPLTCCTELILQAEVRKVFIGILDPNQGVCGKGVLTLQSRGIDVELFPPALASKIRVINDEFIRTQQSLGIRITEPKSGQTIRTYDKGGIWIIRGVFVNAPKADVFAFISSPRGHWLPQPHPLIQIGAREWEVKVHFGTYGLHTIYIMRANELGMTLVNYYRKVVRTNLERKNQLRGNLNPGLNEDHFVSSLRGDYQGIEMARIPKGLEVQDKVEVDVEKQPA